MKHKITAKFLLLKNEIRNCPLNFLCEDFKFETLADYRVENYQCCKHFGFVLSYLQSLDFSKGDIFTIFTV